MPRGDLAAWLAQARTSTLAERSALLVQLGERGWRDTLAQLEVIAQWQPDPRTARALLRLFSTTRYRSGPSKPLWTAMFEQLLRLADDEVKAALSTTDIVAYRRSFPTFEMGRFVSSALRRCQRELERRAAQPLDGGQRALLATLTDRVAECERGVSLEALEAQVYDDPASDEARQVYADALSERGDPRGEFIMLQLLAELTPAQRERIEALRKQHAVSWLGPLRPVLYKSDLVYRRGFVAEALLHAGARELSALTELAMWRTLEALSMASGNNATVYQLLTSPSLQGLRRVTRLPGALAAPVLDRDDAWALGAMHVWGHYDEQGEQQLAQAFGAALSREAAANICELGLIYSSSPRPWHDQWSCVLARPQVCQRLTTLVISSDSQSQHTHEAWLHGSIERELPVPNQRYCDEHGKYRHRSGWRYELTRSDDGHYALEASYVHRRGKGDHFSWLAELLSRLPARSLTALSVKAPRYRPSDDERARLDAVVERFSWQRAPKLALGRC